MATRLLRRHYPCSDPLDVRLYGLCYRLSVKVSRQEGKKIALASPSTTIVFAFKACRRRASR